TVDFDAQDDSFMAKHLVESGAQDIPVGTPIFVTVDDASAVDAFKDFTADAAAPPPPEAAETETEKVESPPPSPPPAAAPPAPKAEPVAAPPAAAAKPVPVAAPAVAPGAAQGAAVHKVFKRDWGSGVKGSPLAHRMSAEQKKYVEKFGSTLQTPLEP
ncbi:unnamed protein product, partial [Sphacelaria rigidula]